MSKPKNTFAHCYWCDRTFGEIPERKHERGGRMVAFCGSKCFRNYILANFVPRIFIREDAGGLLARLDTALTDLKSESLFLPDSSPKKQVDEEMIALLSFIRDGRETVSCHERMVRVVARR